MVNGTVDFFNDRGGYGFIKVDDSEETDLDDNEEVFYHISDVSGPNLEEGTNVEFEIEQSDRGPREQSDTIISWSDNQ